MSDRFSNRLRRIVFKAERSLYTRRLLSPKRLTLPDFLGIGAPKCGTTWLYENLRAHPSLFLPDEKELEFFQNTHRLSLRWYAANFVAAGGRVKGEVSPSYCTLTDAKVRLVKHLLPRVKLIFLIRNPVERAWSFAYMKLVTQSGRPVEAISDREFRDQFGRNSVLQAGGYTGILDRWVGAFGRERVLVVPYDLIGAEPRSLLATVFDFLDVPLPTDWSAFPYHEVIIPPAGAAFAEHPQGRGVRVTRYTGSERYLPERFRAVLDVLFRPDLEALAAKYGVVPSKWLE